MLVNWLMNYSEISKFWHRKNLVLAGWVDGWMDGWIVKAVLRIAYSNQK